MAISEMKKIRMVVHKSVSDKVMSRIQALGCCHFISDDHVQPDEKDVAVFRDRMKKVDEMLAEAKSSSRFLETFPKTDANADAAFTFERLAEAASEESFRPTIEKLTAYDKQLADIRNKLSASSSLLAQIKPLDGLNCSLDFYSVGSSITIGHLVSVANGKVEQLKSMISRSVGSLLEISSIPDTTKDGNTIVSIICSRTNSQDVVDAVSKVQASRVDVPSGISETAAEKIMSLSEEIKELERSEKAIVAEIEKMSPKADKDCRIFSDYWNIEKSRLSTLLAGEQTEQISIYKFWIPSKAMSDLKMSLAEFDALTDIAEEQPKDGELAPTLLINKGLAEPVEPLIEMYGTPTYGGLDPSAIVAPFFYMFFGICFGDAGYGLLIAALLIFVMIKKHLTGTMKKFAMILIIGNICALIFGALTFSWFGDSISAFGGEKYPGFTFLSFLAPLGKLQILDPMTDPMTMLYVSLALGFLQIMVGLLVAMYMNLKQGKTFAAFADQGGWIIFLIGLVLVGLTKTGAIPFSSDIATGVAAAGAVILVATQGREKKNIFGKLISGVMSLYNVTGYLGDVLSYSRLLALGLGSAAVGMVINLLVTLVSGIEYVGPVLGVIVFILGHLFGIAANILGAFVHSLRLQYVEFFGKFHEAAGMEYRPLRMITQFVKLQATKS